MKRTILIFLWLTTIFFNSFGQLADTVKVSFGNIPITSAPLDHDADTSGAIIVQIEDINSLNVSNADSWLFFKFDTTRRMNPDTIIKNNNNILFKFTKLGGDLATDSILVKIRGNYTVSADSILKDTLLWEFLINKFPASVISNGITPSANTPKPPTPDYLAKIQKLHPNFQRDKVYLENNTVFLFVGEDLERIPGTEFPDCIARNTSYIIQYFTTKEDSKVSFRSEARQGPDIGIAGAQSGAIDTVKIFQYTSKSFGPFDEGADFFIEVDSRPAKNFPFNSCSQFYHVSISAGFFGSSLNYPENITQDGTDGILYADNPTSQRALTIMALFYPIPRDPFYKYKELSFWQKWSFSFGTKLSQNLFDDLLLGLNFEFSKGGNFTGGIHYGQHRVIRGIDKFQFGKDEFKGTFDNTKTNLRWDTGIFLGVTLDLRIVNALRAKGGDQRRRASEDSNSTN